MYCGDGLVFLIAKYLLVVAGENTARSEVVSLDPSANPVPECMRNVGSFSFSTSSATGAVINQGLYLVSRKSTTHIFIPQLTGVPLICGGHSNDNSCYKYFDGSWTKSGKFPTPWDRTAGTYDSYGLGMVLAGGYNITAAAATRDGRTFRQIASLPDHSAHACLITIDKESNLLYIGGYREAGNVNDVFKYLAVGHYVNWFVYAILGEARVLYHAQVPNKWQRMASMPTSRHVPTCSTVGREVVVAGGSDNTGSTTIVEIYSIDYNSWRTSSPEWH